LLISSPLFSWLPSALSLARKVSFAPQVLTHPVSW